VDTATARTLYEQLSAAIAAGLVASCHDCSDGGLGAALAECAFAGGYGMELDLSPLGNLDPAVLLFSESQSRFVVTVAPEFHGPFEQALAGSSLYRLGEVTANARLCVLHGETTFVDAALEELKAAWQAPLRL